MATSDDPIAVASAELWTPSPASTAAPGAVGASSSALPASGSLTAGTPAPGDPVDPPRPAVWRGRRLPVAAVVATGWAALVSFAPVFALMLLSGGATVDVWASARLAGAGWLLGHGVALPTPGDEITLIPLALLGLVLWRLARAGVHVSRAVGGHRGRSLAPLLSAALAVGMVYGVLGAVVATLVAGPDLPLSAGAAALRCGGIGFAAAALGALGHSRAGRRWLRRLPAVLGDGLRAGVLACAFMLAVGAAAAGVSLAIRGGDAAAVLGGFKAGVLGQAGITVMCLAYAPNAAIWATSYLIGPGFALGVGTTVSPSAVLVGPVPALPLLPGVPDAPIAGVGPALLAAPLVAALAAGWLLGRRHRTGWAGLIGSAGLGGLLAGGLLTAACWASSGGIGSGRLAELGPPAALVGAWGAALATAGLVLGAVVARSVARPRP